MTGISAIASTAQLWKMFGNTGASAGASAFPPDPNAANSAGSTSTTAPSLPSGMQISMETLLALQSHEAQDQQATTQDVSLTPPTPEQQFLQEANKSPMERLREQILKSLGVSEDQLAQMPAEQRRAMEDKIAQIIREKIRQGTGVDQADAGSSSDAGTAISAVA